MCKTWQRGLLCVRACWQWPSWTARCAQFLFATRLHSAGTPPTLVKIFLFSLPSCLLSYSYLFIHFAIVRQPVVRLLIKNCFYAVFIYNHAPYVIRRGKIVFTAWINTAWRALDPKCWRLIVFPVIIKYLLGRWDSFINKLSVRFLLLCFQRKRTSGKCCILTFLSF